MMSPFRICLSVFAVAGVLLSEALLPAGLKTMKHRRQQVSLLDEQSQDFRSVIGVQRNDYNKETVPVAFTYWLQAPKEVIKVSNLTVPLESINQNMKESLGRAFGENDLAKASISVDDVRSGIIGLCEEDFPVLSDHQCVVMSSKIDISFIPDNIIRINTNYLRDATIGEVGKFMDEYHGNNTAIEMRLRSPIGVSTVLNFYFHDLFSPMSSVEEDIVKRSFYNDYEQVLARHDPAFSLTGVDVIFNAVVGKTDQQRKLYLRVSNLDHFYTALRVDLFVQATCEGLECNHDGFNETVYKMVESTRKTFVDTLIREGHFTAFNDYFVDLLYITLFKNSSPKLADDDSLFFLQDSSEGYFAPWWFWTAIILVTASIAGSAFLIIFAAKRYPRQQKIDGNKPELLETAKAMIHGSWKLKPTSDGKACEGETDCSMEFDTPNPPSTTKIPATKPIDKPVKFFYESPHRVCSPICEASSESQTTSTGKSPKKSPPSKFSQTSSPQKSRQSRSTTPSNKKPSVKTSPSKNSSEKAEASHHL